MNICKLVQPEQYNWQHHPSLQGAELAYLLSEENDAADLTCALVHLAKTTPAQAHCHEASDDILFVLRGNGQMWVEGSGDIALHAGVFLRIPKGCRHYPHSITEDVHLYNVWSPALR